MVIRRFWSHFWTLWSPSERSRYVLHVYFKIFSLHLVMRSNMFFCVWYIRPSKKKITFLVRISIKKRAGRRFFLLFIISYCMLSLHIITFPQELLGQILVKRNIRYWLYTSLFKVPLWQKINYDFSLDIKTMLTKHQVTQVLSLDSKNSPAYFNWNFPI